MQTLTDRKSRAALKLPDREVTRQQGEAEVDLCNCQAGRLACGQCTEFNHPCHCLPHSRRILPAAMFPGLVPCQAGMVEFEMIEIGMVEIEMIEMTMVEIEMIEMIKIVMIEMIDIGMAKIEVTEIKIIEIETFTVLRFFPSPQTTLSTPDQWFFTFLMLQLFKCSAR